MDYYELSVPLIVQGILNNSLNVNLPTFTKNGFTQQSKRCLLHRHIIQQYYLLTFNICVQFIAIYFSLKNAYNTLLDKKS